MGKPSLPVDSGSSAKSGTALRGDIGRCCRDWGHVPRAQGRNACRQPIHNPFTSLFTRTFTTLTTFLGRRRLEFVTREGQFKASASAPFRVARRLANRSQTGCKRVAYTCRRPASSDALEFALSAMMSAAVIQVLPCAAFFTEGLRAFAFLVSRHASFRSMACRGTAAPCYISWHEPTHSHARSLNFYRVIHQVKGF